MNAAAELTRVVQGQMAINGTRLDVADALSSHTTKITVLPEAYSGVVSNRGTNPRSHMSPAATEQLCMSLQMFGVTNVKAAESGTVAPSGVSWLAHGAGDTGEVRRPGCAAPHTGRSLRDRNSTASPPRAPANWIRAG